MPKAELPALVWAHPDATEQSPMLVAHDRPEYAEHSALLTLLGQLPPLRATLLGPVDRNETYSASTRYARALAHAHYRGLLGAWARDERG